MKWTTHTQMVCELRKPPEAIIASLTNTRMDCIHAVMGIVGEAGELLDSIKKTVIYNKSFDYSNIEEELGDMEFYLEQLRQALGLNRDIILNQNMLKLNKRYGDTYSDKAAQERIDKT